MANRYHIEFDIDFRRNEFPGLFIALEGIDASGKSTQVKKLQQEFEKDGKKAIIKHPFEGELGDFIRTILSGEKKVPTVALQYLISANRHVQQGEIIEHLKKGEHIIIDRYIWSAVVYGIFDKAGKDYRKGANWLLLEQSILSLYHQFLSPDLTFFLDISPAVAWKRITSMGKPQEIYEDEKKIQAITEIYQFVVNEYKDEFVVVNGDQSIEAITQEMMSAIKKSPKYLASKNS